MTAMYKLPRLVEVPRVLEVPGTMYRMPVVNSVVEEDTRTRATEVTQNGPGVAALEAKQEAVLARLWGLKAQLDQMQGNKVVTTPPTTSTSATPAVGAAAHASPLKSEMVQAVTAMGNHLADLTGLQFDSLLQPRGEEGRGNTMRLHDSVLHRLGCLRAELDRLTAASKCTVISPEEPLSLAQQQKGILRVIVALKDEMRFLAHLQNQPVAEKCSVNDLVISACPSQPPYSLLLLRKALREAGSPVYSSIHVHSSVGEVNETLRICFTDQPLAERRNHTLAFTLHWKDVTAPTLMVSPLRQTLICGEVNIVRYISRLFPLASPYNYEATGTFTTITEADQLLDLLDRQLAGGNNKERQSVLRLLNGRLGKSSFLLGNTCGVADILAWSLVKQCVLHVGAPSNVARWYTTLSSLECESQAIESKDTPRTEKLKPENAGPQKVNVELKKQVIATKPSQETKRPTSGVSVNGEVLGKSHMNRAGLEAYLKGLGIAYRATNHEEVFTVEALMKAVAEKKIVGLHMKNLFLKDKKKKDLYLLSARHDAEVKLNDVAKQLGLKELRFAEESVMLEVIGVTQGCVTPFALANDVENKVTMLLDSAALDPSHTYVNFHPLTNAATMGVSPKDFRKFLEATGHEPKLLNFT